jgi:hypothetical protein
MAKHLIGPIAAYRFQSEKVKVLCWGHDSASRCLADAVPGKFWIGEAALSLATLT